MYTTWANLPTSKVVDAVKEKIPKGERIIDIGCGPGDYTIHLATEGFHTIGIDSSKDMIDVCQEKLKHLNSPKEFFDKINKKVRSIFVRLALFSQKRRLYDQVDNMLEFWRNAEYVGKPITGSVRFIKSEFGGGDIDKNLKKENAHILVSAVLQHIPDLKDFLPKIAYTVGKNKYLMILNYKNIENHLSMSDYFGEDRLNLLKKGEVERCMVNVRKTIPLQEFIESLGFRLDKTKNINGHKLFFFKKVEEKPLEELKKTVNEMCK